MAPDQWGGRAPVRIEVETDAWLCQADTVRTAEEPSCWRMAGYRERDIPLDVPPKASHLNVRHHTGAARAETVRRES